MKYIINCSKETKIQPECINNNVYNTSYFLVENDARNDFIN